MSWPFVVLGDTSSHGGSVNTATAGFTVDGIVLAAQGDNFECPLYGTVAIQAAGHGIRANGKAPARDGDATSCGASLMASHKNAKWQE